LPTEVSASSDVPTKKLLMMPFSKVSSFFFGGPGV
jgi:hypothetical protein